MRIKIAIGSTYFLLTSEQMDAVLAAVQSAAYVESKWDSVTQTSVSLVREGGDTPLPTVSVTVVSDMELDSMRVVTDAMRNK